VVQVHYDEGVANRIGPEPCVVGREAGGEASAGVPIGQPLSRETINRDADVCHERKAKRGCASTRAHVRPCVVEDPGTCVNSSAGIRETSTLATREVSGPHREGDEPKPMMHGDEGSGPAIVAVKRTNEAGRPAKEFVEPRAGAGRDDGLVEVAPLIERCGGRFANLLAEEPDPARIAALRAAETIGRPIGAGAFLDRLAALTGRDPRPGKRRRKSLAAQAIEGGARRVPKK
jgi:hypothetical protein